jgi:hypothetical protein
LSLLIPLKKRRRTDLKAIGMLRIGLQKWMPNVRFITLSGLINFKKNFRSLKLWLNRTKRLISYFGVRTDEGKNGGVIHFVYAGKSVRYSDLSKKWKEITGFWTVSISKVTNLEAIIQEMTRQNLVVRYFHSIDWATERKYRQTIFG